MNGTSHDHREDLLSLETVSQALASLPPRVSPPGLTHDLRVLALRERQRRVSRRSLGQICRGWYDRLRLAVADVMRPMALPVAGGVFSAILLFSMWLVPTYPIHAAAGSFDVPIMLTVATDPMLSGSAPLGLGDADVVVEVSVDDQGHMVDYKVLSGQSLLQDSSFRRRLENSLLFTVFTPATSFGHRTSGKLRVPFIGSSSIIVKG